MWTETTRAQYRRDELSYASDTREAEWAQIAPLVPPPRRLGRVQGYFYRWRDEGTWAPDRCGAGGAGAPARRAQRRALGRDYRQPKRTDPKAYRPRKAAARAASMTASASREASAAREASATSSPTPRASCSRSGCMKPTSRTRTARCRCCARRADRVYRGEQSRNAVADCGPWTIEIVEPRRWVVERTLAWLGRSRRLAKDFEATIPSAIAWVLLAHLRLLSRRLAKA